MKNEKIMLFLMLCAMVIWGGSWVSGKILSHVADPQAVVFWRLSISFVTFIPMVIWSRESLIVDKKSFILITINGILLLAYSQCFFIGLKDGLPGAGGIIVTTLSPIFTFIFAKLVSKNRFSRSEIIGLSAGILSGVLMLQLWKVTFSDAVASGNIYFLAGAVIWSLITYNSFVIMKRVSIFSYSLWYYGIASFGQIFFAYNSIGSVFSLGFDFWINILYTAIVSSTFASTLYFVVGKKIGPSRGSSFMFVVPFSALILSFIFFGTVPSIYTILGGATAIAAITVINRQNKKTA